MEQPFKRRRVSRRGEGRMGESNPGDGLWSQWNNHDPIKEKGPMLQKGTPLKAFDGATFPLDGSKSSPRASIPRNGGNAMVHPRNLIHRRNSDSPQNTAVISVIQVVVHSGDATPTNVFIPAGSSVFSLPGYGPVTLNNPVSLSPPVSYIRVPASNSQAPRSTQVSASTSPAAPSSQSSTSPSQATQSPESAPTSVPSTAPTGSTSMSINLQGLSSQQVISPSPSSPLPPSPASSDSANITGSFFPSSSTDSSQSSRVETPSSQETQPSNSHSLVVTSGSVSVSSPRTTSTTESSTTSRTSLDSTSRTSNSESASTISHLSRSFQTSTTSTQSTTSLSSLSSTSAFITSSSTLASTVIPEGGAVGGGFGGVGSTAIAPSPSSTTAVGSGSSIDNTPSTPVVVGGVVGGLAGLSIILVLVLFLLRRRRKKLQSQALAPPTAPAGEPSQGTVTQRSSAVPLAGSGFFKRLRPNSGQTAATTDTAPSERGFQNFGGRKLESVLSSRGDGYGEPGPSSAAGTSAAGTSAAVGSSAGIPQGQSLGHSPGPSEQETLSGSSFYRDEQGFYGGKSSPSSMVLRTDSPSTSFPSYLPPVGAGLPPESIGEYGRRSEIAFMRPGPARTPVTNQPGFTPMRNAPRPPRNTPSPRGSGTPSTPRPPGSSSSRPGTNPSAMSMTAFPRLPDELGRSHPSFDGSRGSRFTEEV